MSEPMRAREPRAPRWGGMPPAPRHRMYPFIHVTSTTPIKLQVLSERVEVTWTHFVNGRTCFCTSPDGDCWASHQFVGKPRYGAWLAVLQLGSWGRKLLRLTAQAVNSDPRLKDSRICLRGRTLQVWRVHGIKNTEMATVLGDDLAIDAAKLPPAFDVRTAVENFVNAPDRPNRPQTKRAGPIRAAYEAECAERKKRGAL